MKEETTGKENLVTMLGRLFMLDMKNTLDNKKSQNNRQVKRKGKKKEGEQEHKPPDHPSKTNTHITKQKATKFKSDNSIKKT